MIDIGLLMDLWQSPFCSAPSPLHLLFLNSILFPSLLQHFSIHPCFPLVSSFIPVSLFHWFPLPCYHDPLLSCQDPCLIAELPSNPRLISYHFPNSVPTILWVSDTMLTIPPNSNWPLGPLMHYHHSLRPPNDLWGPQPHFCLHYSVLVSLHSNLIFTSLSQFSSFQFWYIAPFQYSCSLVLASTLPLYISTSLPLNSCDPL